MLGNTHRSIIRQAVVYAHKLGLKCYLDLIGSQSLTQNALDAADLGVDALQVHYQLSFTSSDSVSEQWEMLRANTTLPIFISTGINRNTITQATNLNPAGLIIGGSITEHTDPKTEVQYFYERIIQK